MPSIRHKQSEDDLLDAARACILATGWTRTTLTDVARRAGVSRMTLYRTWPDMQTLLADLMTREWAGVVTEAAAAESEAAAPARVGRGVVRTVAALRGNELFRKIVDVDPELLLPYLLHRRGRSQQGVLDLLVPVVAQGQAEGTVRAGDPALLARAVLLAAHGFTLSADTMADDGVSVAALDGELRALLESYLAP